MVFWGHNHSENHIKLLNTDHGQNAEVLNVKGGYGRCGISLLYHVTVLFKKHVKDVSLTPFQDFHWPGFCSICMTIAGEFSGNIIS
jgi:hypothetical protein